MSVVRLKEVFVVREANVTTLAQMNKLPFDVANKINEFDRKWAPQLAQIFADRHRSARYSSGSPESQLAFWGACLSFLESDAPRIVYLLNKDPSKKQELVDLAKKDWRSFLKMIRDNWNNRTSEMILKRASLKFPDGFYWVKLESRNEESEEGRLMQHCGAAMGEMWSLRDPNNKPHVTIDVTGPSGPDGPLEASQIRGKQNEVPDKKYWKYIEELFKKEKIIPADDHVLKDPLGAELMKLLGHDGA